MSRSLKTLSVVALLVLTTWAQAQTSTVYPGIGRAATPKEVAAWDIDVRPDFKGLPAGAGTVAKGQDVWETKCASCHGIFGDSNEVFSPLIGGVTADDIKTGRVAKLRDSSFPGRTTLMKVPTVSTLWDYINRAMPWTQPKSLTVEEVYSVTAFLLNLSGVVPDNFTLSDKNIAEVQNRMPNRNGMSAQHALWPGKEFGSTAKPDTRNVACMKDCATEPKVASFLPDFARNQHGNLAEQNRLVGAQHGADTTRPESKSKSAAQAAPAAPANAQVTTAAPVASPIASGADNKAALALTQKYVCVACHAVNQKLVGPSFSDIAKKHAGKADYLAGKIKSGGSGVWGAMPMPPQSLNDADARTIATWLATGAAK
jgi:S-disulfanyl-L-cysteine oxidoreductase SoxD